MKRRTLCNPNYQKEQPTESTLNQEPDRNSLTFSIPRALLAIPILSEKERMIIARITSLSSKYSDKGGCNLTNEALAHRQECSTSTVSIAISKATWLGMLQLREDNVDKHPNEDGTISITQRRRLKLVIPEIWTIFGEKWADFYFGGDESAKQALDWIRAYVTKKYNNRVKKLDLLQMIKDAYRNFNRGGLEIHKAPFINSKGCLLEDTALLMFTEVNVYGSKRFSVKDISLKDKKPKNNSSKPSAKERNEKYLPLAEQLSKIIQSTKNISFPHQQIAQWCDEIRKLAENNKVEYDRIKQALDWYKKNVGGEYIPVIESGSSLRSKFMKLEAAIDRSNGKLRKTHPPGSARSDGRPYPVGNSF